MRSWSYQAFALPTQDVAQLAFAADGASLIAVDNATDYRVFSVELDGRLIREYSAYKFQLGVKVMETTPKRNVIALGSYDQKVRTSVGSSWSHGHPRSSGSSAR